MQVMRVASRIRDYEVRFAGSPDFIRGLAGLPYARYLVDENVWRLYRGRALAPFDRERVTVLPIGEERKTLDVAQGLYETLLGCPAKRNMTLVTIGGGMAQDLTGFAASTLYRGVRWILVPTTLLAQADSCIGGKTSLNFKGYKNLLGTFYPPHEVHIDTLFLKTLSEPDYYSGLGEVIKLHLLGGAKAAGALFAQLPALRRREQKALLRAIQASLAIKRSFCQDDEFDLGRRNNLNFGHCFGHALEATSDFAVPHGQAVLIGILFANIVAQRRKLLSPATSGKLAGWLLQCILVRPKPEHLGVDGLLAALRQDKKRTGQGLTLIMMREDHSMVKVDDLSPAELGAATRRLAELLGLRALESGRRKT